MNVTQFEFRTTSLLSAREPHLGYHLLSSPVMVAALTAVPPLCAATAGCCPTADREPCPVSRGPCVWYRDAQGTA